MDKARHEALRDEYIKQQKFKSIREKELTIGKIKM